MKFDSLQKDCASECYTDVEPLILKTVSDFRKTHGGDFDDLMDIAHFAYLSAFRRFDPAGGSSFPSWVRYEVHTCLLNDFIKRQKDNKRLKTVMSERSSSESHNPFIDFVDELSEDAETIVNLIVSTPDDLMEIIQQSGGGIKKVKTTVYNYLRNLGWKRGRVLQSFEQIQKALE